MAYLLIKRMLRDPANRRSARLAESLMEQLAYRCSRPDSSDQWAMMGLLAFVDAEYAASNPAVRGQVARQAAQLDGLSADLAELLEGIWEEQKPPVPLLDALRLAVWLAEQADTPDIARALELRRATGDARGDLLDEALGRLGLSAVEAAKLVGQAKCSAGARP